MDKPDWTHRIVEIHESDGQAFNKFLIGALCKVESGPTENLREVGYVSVSLRVNDGSNDYGGVYNFRAVQIEALNEVQEDEPPVVGPSLDEPITIPHEEPLGGGDAEVHTPEE